MSKKRKIEEEHRNFQKEWTDKYCFIKNGEAIICIICNQSIGVPKEYNLKRHFEKKHKDFNDKFAGDFRKQKITSLLKSIKCEQNVFKTFSDISKDSIEVSFEIALLLATCSRPFTDGEFVKKCLKKASTKLCCSNCVTKFEAVSLNRMTMQRRIIDMSSQIKGKFSEVTNKFVYYSLAVDESTDITSTSQLAIFIRGVTSTFDVYEELLELCPMKGQTRGSDLLQCLLTCLSKQQLDLTKLIGIVTDGAPAMIGRENGMVSLLSKHRLKLGIQTKLKNYHCIIHQQNLIGKKLGFDNIMKYVISVVCFLRSNALNHRQFKEFLNEIEAEYSDVIYFSEIRWLSRGKVLERFLALIEEIKMYLLDKNQPIDNLENSQWLCDLAFLTDISAHMNTLNLKLQGKNLLISDLANNILAFQVKLLLFQSQLEKNNTCHFPNSHSMFEKYNQQAITYAEHIHKLQLLFKERFKDFDTDKIDFRTFANPFEVSYEHSDPTLQLELIDLQCNEELKIKFKEGNILNFYKCLQKESFPELIERAAICSCLFGSTYICEQLFSLMKLNKSVHRNRLSDENLVAILKLNTTNFKPDIASLVSDIQVQSFKQDNKF